MKRMSPILKMIIEQLNKMNLFLELIHTLKSVYILRIVQK